MKVVVAIKQVRTLGDEVAFREDGSDVDPDYLDRVLNEWDACAVEEAVRMRERVGVGEGEVVVVTVGDGEADAALRRCLAMGADRAIRVAAEPVDPVATARALAGVVSQESPQLVLAGAQSSDSVQGSTGAALAGLLDWPTVAVVTKLTWDGSAAATVDRELEGGIVDVVEVDLPAVLTIQTGINEPRYANLRAIKQAEQREIAVADADCGEPAYRVRRMFTPARDGGAELIGGTAAQVAQRISDLIKERLP
jgi:electron transfer flavoprotein beta subunit